MSFPCLLRRALCCCFLITTAAYAADTPASGDPAPAFSLTSQSGTQVSLKAYKGSWLLLFFFGDHSTADMDLYARHLQRDEAKYSAYNAHVIGIGRTTPESNLAWARKNELTFPLLSDPDQKVAAAYGVPANVSNGVSDGGIYFVFVAPDGKLQLPGITTSDVDGDSDHMLACLQYFKDHP